MKNLSRAVVAALLVLATAAHAEPLRPGMPMPQLRLADQHDVEMAIGPDVRYVVFTRDMDAGNLVKEALADDGGPLLETAHAVYISDISRMPGLVTKLFALPAMRKRGYRILLDRDGKATADVPSEEGKITVLDVDGDVVARIHFVGSAAAFRTLLVAK